MEMMEMLSDSKSFKMPQDEWRYARDAVQCNQIIHALSFYTHDNSWTHFCFICLHSLCIRPPWHLPLPQKAALTPGTFLPFSQNGKLSRLGGIGCQERCFQRTDSRRCQDWNLKLVAYQATHVCCLSSAMMKWRGALLLNHQSTDVHP